MIMGYLVTATIAMTEVVRSDWQDLAAKAVARSEGTQLSETTALLPPIVAEEQWSDIKAAVATGNSDADDAAADDERDGVTGSNGESVLSLEPQFSTNN